eukprot:m.91091 g.91091  ORF g.91091 m.91091 type:complete len:194 (-) comp12322_c0_seq19:596-1177(-)
MFNVVFCLCYFRSSLSVFCVVAFVFIMIGIAATDEEKVNPIDEDAKVCSCDWWFLCACMYACLCVCMFMRYIYLLSPSPCSFLISLALFNGLSSQIDEFIGSQNIFRAFSLLAFAFTCHTTMFPIYLSLKQRTVPRMMKAIHSAMVSFSIHPFIHSLLPLHSLPLHVLLLLSLRLCADCLFFAVCVCWTVWIL